MDEYITFVEQQLDIFKQHSMLLDRNHEITPMLLNKNLAEYTNVGVALNLEYQRAKKNFSDMKRDYGVWWDEVYCNMRHKLNPLELAGTKWSSQKEIEAEARIANKEMFLEWDQKIQAIEMKVSFLNSLREQWQDHAKIIITLSNNARQEMMYLPTEAIRREKQANTN